MDLVKSTIGELGMNSQNLDWIQSILDGSRDEALNRIIDGSIERLLIPKELSYDVSGESVKQLTATAEAFRQSAHTLLVILRRIISDSVELQLTKKQIVSCLAVCGSFVGNSSSISPDSLWTDDQLRLDAMRLLDSLTIKCNAKSATQLMQDLFSLYISGFVKPFFSSHPDVDEEGHSKPKSKPSSQNETDVSFYANQRWKTESVACVDSLEFFVYQLRQPHVAPLQHLLFPPILTLMDDHEPRFKVRGIRMLKHAFISESAPVSIRRTGLCQKLIESLSTSVSFMDDSNLMEESLEAIRLLLPISYDKDSKEFIMALDGHLRDGIFRWMTYAIGDKVRSIRVLLKECIKLFELCPVLSFKYLKVSQLTINMHLLLSSWILTQFKQSLCWEHLAKCLNCINTTLILRWKQLPQSIRSFTYHGVGNYWLHFWCHMNCPSNYAFI